MTTRAVLWGGTNQPVAAGQTAQYSCQLLDQNGNAVPASALLTLTLSIVDTASMAIINGCDAQNILNANRGTVDSQGNVVVTLIAPGDTALLNPADQQEVRSLVLDWTYGAGPFVGRHQVDFLIVALSGP